MTIENQDNAFTIESVVNLAADATFTGDSHDAEDYNRIRVGVMASHQGTLYIQQSPDNVNWDLVDSFAVVGGVAQGVEVDLVHRYVRVVYTNGPTIQTAFRLHSKQIPI